MSDSSSRKTNPKLNQIIAIEKGVKSRHHKVITNLHRVSAQPGLYNGFHKTYNPKDEDGDRFPNEDVRVQRRVPDALDEIQHSLGELLDITATKDIGNTQAYADLRLEDGTVILERIPPTFLLFLEKQMADLQTFVTMLPELDPANDWEYDAEQRIYKTAPVATIKTKKDQVPLVMYDATEKHPAQTQLITRDVTIGTWHTVKTSGAVSPERKKAMLDRIETLQKAIKFARETANNTEVQRIHAGKAVLGYVLGGN